MSKKNDVKNFSSIDFLQVERARQEKIKTLFSQKVSAEEQFSHSRNLYQKQLAHKTSLQAALIEIMMDEKSSFQKSLKNFFQQVF